VSCGVSLWNNEIRMIVTTSR